jgi:hypothetical protein
MNYAMVHHQVTDFAKWKAGYDSHLPARSEAGLKEVKVIHGIDNPNEVVILFEVADVARARTFATSDDLRIKLKEFGVVGQPEIVFLTD